MRAYYRSNHTFHLLACSLILLMTVQTCYGNASGGWLGWILGRTASPFYDPPIHKPPKEIKAPAVLPEDMTISKIPFEVSSADDKFLVEAQKYTSLQLSELDTCQHKVILNVQSTCADLSEEDISKLGVNLLNCQSAIEGRPIFPCTSAMSLRECTAEMNAETWNAYHIVSNRARSVCYSARQQQFRAMTEMAVNKLMQSANHQLLAMKALKENQEELSTLSAKTLDSVSQGQQELLTQQGALQSAQQQTFNQISSNIQDLGREKAMIAAGNKEMSKLINSVRSRLEDTANMLAVQGDESRGAHLELLEDLNFLESKISNVWHQMDDAMRQMTITQQDSLEMLTQTFNSLSKVNETVNYLLALSDRAKDQLDWFGKLLTSSDEKIKQGWIWMLHTAYLLCGMIALSFLQTPAFTRGALLLILPLNLVTQLRNNDALDWAGLIVLLTSLTLIRNLCLRLMSICKKSPKQEPIQRAQILPVEHEAFFPQHRIESSQHNDVQYSESDDSQRSQSSFELMRLNESISRNQRRNSIPSLGTPDSAKRNLFPEEPPKTPPMSLRARRWSTTSSILGTPLGEPVSLSLTPTNSRSGTPRRSSATPRPPCRGICQSGRSCQKPASISSIYCYIHQTSITE